MAKERLAGTLAVILHADVASSTRLVQQDEHLAHERIQDAFHRFSDTIGKYQGRVRELRGDALLAEFELASDAVTAALAFQSEHQDHLAELNDDIQPRVRIGIAMGEVVIADHTVTGAGVVLAQRIEQLAEPGSSWRSRGVCVSPARFTRPFRNACLLTWIILASRSLRDSMSQSMFIKLSRDRVNRFQRHRKACNRQCRPGREIRLFQLSLLHLFSAQQRRTGLSPGYQNKNRHRWME